MIIWLHISSPYAGICSLFQPILNIGRKAADRRLFVVAMQKTQPPEGAVRFIPIG